MEATTTTNVRRFKRVERFVEIPDATPREFPPEHGVRLSELPDGRLQIETPLSDSTVKHEDLRAALDVLRDMAPTEPDPVEQQPKRAGL